MLNARRPEGKIKRGKKKSKYYYRTPTGEELLDVETIRNNLPKVGEILFKVPNFYTYYGEQLPRKTLRQRPCTVIAVYPKTLCYLVEFQTPGGNYKEFRRFTD